jgi:autotransporter-associated beta strand protein
MKKISNLMPYTFAVLMGVFMALHSTVVGAGLTASDGATGDSFGSVSLSGSTGFVGATWDDIGANSNQGSAYVFRGLDTATGAITQNVKLTASDGAASDLFGSVSLSGSVGLVGAEEDDIGANNQGSAYVFRGLDTATGTITENVKLTASDGAANDRLGWSVSLSGSTGLVGAIYDTIGANNQGSAYVFRGLDTASGTVTQNVKLTASDGAADDYFGCSVSLFGSTGLIGAYNDDIGANNAQGSAYVFRGLDMATGTMTENAKLTASDGAASDEFGYSVSLSGSTGLVGACYDDVGANSNQGSAYIFRGLDMATGTITQNVKLTASDGAASDYFGWSVSLSGSTGLVGASSDDIGANSSQGSVYVFRGLDTATGTMTESVKLIASDGAANDRFGGSVSLDGDQFLIGAYGKNSSTGKAYSGSVSSVTTLDAGSTSKTISGISFISQDDWIIGQTTDSNQVTLSSGDSANVTGSGKAVYIGQNAGSDNNKLIVIGSLTANQIVIGAAGNTGNTLQIGDGATNGTLSTSSVIVNNGILDFRGSGTITQGSQFGSAAITGTGALIQAGSGILVLNAANTYTGDTTVNAGTLQLGAAGAISNSSNLVVNGGVFDLAGFDETVGTVTLQSGTISNSGAAATLTGTSYDVQGGTVSAALGGAGVVLTKSTAGTVTLSGANTYTGATTINAGTLRLSGGSALADSGSVVLADVAGAILDLNNTSETIGALSGGGSTGGNVTLGSATLTAGDTTNTTYAGAMSGTGGLTKAGSGTLILSGTNGYTGATTVNAGTLQLSGGSALADSSNLVVNGGVFDLAGFNETVGTVTLQSGTISNSGAAATLTGTSYDVQSGTVSAVLGGAGVALTKSTAGSVTLSGTNTYTGATTINAGVLEAGSLANGGTSSGIGASTNAAGNLVFNGGTLKYTGGAQSTDRNWTVGTGGATWDASGSGALTLAGATATLSGAGTRTVTLAGTNTGANTLAAALGDNGGATSLVKNGAGTWWLTGANSYSGTTTINAGILHIGGATALGGAGGVTVNGGALEMQGGIAVGAKALSLTGTGVSSNGALRNVSGNNSWAGLVTLAGNTLIRSDDGILTLLGGVATGANALTVNTGTNGRVVIGNALTGSGTINITGGTLELATGVDATGNLFTVGAGAVSGYLVLQTSTQVTGANITLTRGNVTTADASVVTGIVDAVAVNATPGAAAAGTEVVVGTDTVTTYDVSGTVGKAGFDKQGTGTVTLSGTSLLITNNSYVSGGTLVVDGDIRNSNMLVASGSTLMGHGWVGNLINNGLFRPGNSPGTFHAAGDFTQTAAGTTEIEIGGGNYYDKIEATGAAHLDGAVVVTSYGGYKFKGSDYFAGVISAPGGVNGRFATETLPVLTPTLFVDLIYKKTAVDVDIVRDYTGEKSGYDLGLNRNQKAVGRALNSFANGSWGISGDMNKVLDEVDGFTSAGPVRAALDEMAPEEAALADDVVFNMTTAMNSQLQRRFAELRAGRGNTLNGLAERGGGDEWSAKGVGEAKTVEMPVAAEPKFTTFGYVLGGFGSQDNPDQWAREYDFANTGFVAGLDYRVNEHLDVGGYVGYVHSGGDLEVDGTELALDQANIGLFAQVVRDGFYLNGTAGYGANFYDMDRKMEIGSIHRTAQSDSYGHQLNAMVGTGYDFHAKGFRFGPTATLEYAGLWIGDYQERGAKSLDLRVEERQAHSLATTVGARVDRPITLKNGMVLTPSARAAWKHEFLNEASTVTARFEEGDTFSVRGTEAEADSLLVGAGLNLDISDRLGVYVTYDTELARSDMSNHTFSLGVNWKF